MIYFHLPFNEQLFKMYHKNINIRREGLLMGFSARARAVTNSPLLALGASFGAA
jgi:hypothetical protein